MQPDREENLSLLEIILILITVGLTVILYQVAGYKMIVLNLFYLPVVLAAFYLGRYRASVLALLSVILASVVTAVDLPNFAAITSPVAIGLAVTVWGAVLGLTTLLVGTLSDERTAKISELHDAYVGVVEVLSRYLHSANPRMQDRSRRVAELSQKVAAHMRLSAKEIDDIRVAALLQEMEHLEITAKVIRKAVGDLELKSCDVDQNTFHGTDLVHSLGSVLTGALPLLAHQPNSFDIDVALDGSHRASEVPFGAHIIATVRAYDALVNSASVEFVETPARAIERLRNDFLSEHHPAVLHALAQVVHDSSQTVSEDVHAPEERVEAFA